MAKIQDIVSQLDRDSAVAIKDCQEQLKKESLSADLAFISCHLSFLPGAITRLEKAGLPLVEGMSVLEEVRSNINSIPGVSGILLQNKLASVLNKNPGLEILGKVGSVLDGKGEVLPPGIGPGDAANLKFCPLASVDVERSFSVYKNVLSDRRHSLTKESLSKIMICHCFYSVNDE